MSFDRIFVEHMVTLSFTIFSRQKNLNRAHMLFQVLCGFEPIFYTTHPNEEPIKGIKKMKQTDNFKFDEANVMNELVYRNLSEDEKRQICAWKYGGEYDLYNLPSYEEMQVRQIGFMNPQRGKNYYGFWDESILVGFVNILEEKEEIFIGIGVNPDLCNKHYGQRILLITYEISKKLYPNKPLYLEVRTWNIRAIKCYQKAGFRIDGQAYELTTGIGTGTFYRMIRE